VMTQGRVGSRGRWDQSKVVGDETCGRVPRPRSRSRRTALRAACHRIPAHLSPHPPQPRQRLRWDHEGRAPRPARCAERGSHRMFGGRGQAAARTHPDPLSPRGRCGEGRRWRSRSLRATISRRGARGAASLWIWWHSGTSRSAVELPSDLQSGGRFCRNSSSLKLQARFDPLQSVPDLSGIVF
jgi:hypothetical protein